MEHVPLDRCFERLPVDETDDVVGWYRGFGARAIAWPDLLKHRLVVILGEAGSGKTHEMREQTRSLRAEGRAAVFVRFDDLVNVVPDTSLRK